MVYEEDPSEAARLRSDKESDCVTYRLNRGAAFDPTPTRSTAAAVRIPRCWARLSALVLPAPLQRPGSGSGAILFLGERLSPAGNRRLVCVRYFAETYSFTPEFIENYNIEQTVLTPATITTDTSAMAAYRLTSGVRVMSGFPRTPPRVRIFAGQADPDDPTHFTVQYEMWGQSDVLDGRLADNDQVTLTPRKTPQEK